jgi:hypothetical protein
LSRSQAATQIAAVTTRSASENGLPELLVPRVQLDRSPEPDLDRSPRPFASTVHLNRASTVTSTVHLDRSPRPSSRPCTVHLDRHLDRSPRPFTSASSHVAWFTFAGSLVRYAVGELGVLPRIKLVGGASSFEFAAPMTMVRVHKRLPRPFTSTVHLRLIARRVGHVRRFATRPA